MFKVAKVMKDDLDIPTNNKRWFLVRCKSKQEQRASLNFSNQAITSYFPTIDVLKTIRGKTMLKQEALFPGYLFIHLDISSSYASKVNNTFGVYGFVNFAGKPQMVPDRLIEELKTLKDSVIDLTLKSGDQVIINDGSYENVAAIFLEAESEQRSILLIELLNKQVRLSVDNRSIELVAN
ncbi:Transcription antitermination protein [Vibrio scophthalmi]|uniref:transcription/translation regulatory transformer protein RfaH n=1 Tax=Vibrio scophthalmi TaxID=45658 RepID=UPI0008099422|nr:transcription/translation regulatory transformer protein RfaH [Vibrio scophthalmi]ANS84192.1 Transcription antitermination protein [Vibrio scophthalmi]